MGHKAGRKAITPRPIFEEMWSHSRTQTLVAGIELDLFTHIAAGKHTPEEIARAVGASARGTARLLDALVGLGYLRKRGNRYALAPIAAQFLVRGKDSYCGDAARLPRLHWENWAHLAETVKTGRPRETHDSAEQAKEFFPQLVAGIFPASFAAAQAAVAALSQKTRRGIGRILDVAAGSGAWSLAFARTIPEARVTVVDFPEVTPITRKFAERFRLADRYDYSEGDLHQIDFGREAYDLVILGHIIHGEGEVRGNELIRKSGAALRRGGLLLIAEFIPNDSRTGPLIPLLFGLNMLLHTEQGDVFTMQQYRSWLRSAGFRKITTIQAPAPSPLILATK